MRHLVRVSVVVVPAAALATALAAGCTSAPGHPAAQAPSSSSAAQPASSATGPLPTTAAPAASTHLGPAATVRAYYRAINNHNYARAWHLGGRFTGSSYSAFAAGFQDTAHDKVSILSVTGNVVTARLAARQTDGLPHLPGHIGSLTASSPGSTSRHPRPRHHPRRRPRPSRRPGATHSLPADTATSRVSTARPPTRVRPAWPVTAKPSCVCWSPAATTGTRWAELCDQRH